LKWNKKRENVKPGHTFLSNLGQFWN